MKLIVTALLVLFSVQLIAQQPYRDDKKRWGISRDGDGGEKDSIIVRAQYDEIKSLDEYEFAKVFCGMQNDEWALITTNKIVAQQKYSSIIVPDFMPDFAVAYRDGYIDLIKVDTVGNTEFIIRGVQADAVYDGADYLSGYSDFVMTIKGETYGLINWMEGKEVLKANYTGIQSNLNEEVGKIAFIGSKETAHTFHNNKGEKIFEINSENAVQDVKEIVDGGFQLTSKGKKGTLHGFYYMPKKWFIPVEYDEFALIDNLPEAAIVKGKKGYGLYFEGKLILPCEYLAMEKGDKRGYIAIATDKKGRHYVTPEGKLVDL
ncbi:hypothetical protein K6119_06945 [Paracrocinitomix mangrovi]|uniref:hypothetical protein n=1 Tax=Paracrocinitomix mangrovi TaxID=2862509 RepID=UPI001C8EF1CA|nr:hypothetical protein [Paracrocinitomix mangrovi]UKN03250.1 hypothetical protein K6119_06945 [Paracrocinitomix mangrovi]